MDGFDPDVYRDAMRVAFEMAATPDSGEQPWFGFDDTITNTGPAAADGVPFNPAAVATVARRANVHVPCGVEYADASEQPTPFGLMSATRIVVTLMDEDWAKVSDCTHVLLGGDKYLRRRVEPPSGLFDVGIVRVHFTAVTET